MSYISEMRMHIGHAPMLSVGATVVVMKDNRSHGPHTFDSDNFFAPFFRLDAAGVWSS